MKAIQVKQYVNGPLDLFVTHLPTPISHPTKYLIKVRATGVNFFDLLQIRGKYQNQPPLPWISGSEFSSIVVATPTSSKGIGSSLTSSIDGTLNANAQHKFKVGDCVFGSAQEMGRKAWMWFTIQSIKCIAWNGRLLVIGYAGGDIEKVALNRVLLKNISIVGLNWGAHAIFETEITARIWEGIFDMIDKGQIRGITFTDQKFRGLENVPKALKALGDRETWGKVVVEIGENEAEEGVAKL